MGVLLSAGPALSADSGSKPEAHADIDAEIAWARATWPDDLRGLRFRSDLPKLLRWAPTGRPLVVYAHTAEYACRRVDLRPSDVRMGGTLVREIAFVGRVEFDGEIPAEDRATSRSFDELRVGTELARLPDVKDQVRAGRGKWEAAASVGYDAEETVYGALSYVDDVVARFGGESVTIRGRCLGPAEWVPCVGGGGRYCWSCDKTDLAVTAAHAPVPLGGHLHGERATTCGEPCPTPPPSADLGHLDQLLGRISIWRPRKLAPVTIPSLYRSRDECLREHPPRAAPRK
jgi:hypothetical protein